MALWNRTKTADLTRRKLLTSSASRALAFGTATLAGVGLLAAGAVVLREKSRPPTPQDFWAQGDGLHDDTQAFHKLASRPGAYIRVPPGRYLITRTIALLAGQVWQFENAEILYRGEGALFEAKGVDDWALLGVARLQGGGEAASQRPNLGLLIDACRRFRVQNLQFSKFVGAGLTLHGDSSYMMPRGDRGQFSNLGFNECRKGIEIHANAASEYNIFVNTTISACGQGVGVGAGNCHFVGGNVVDCQVGVVLQPGFNHGHGSFQAFNFNHSTEYNLLAEAIQNGYTFSGCNFYGDENGRGAIHLINSRGIQIHGGQLDCVVVNDGKAGKNFIFDNVLPGSHFSVTSRTGDAAGVVCRSAMRLDGTDACEKPLTAEPRKKSKTS